MKGIIILMTLKEVRERSICRGFTIKQQMASTVLRIFVLVIMRCVDQSPGRRFINGGITSCRQVVVSGGGRVGLALASYYTILDVNKHTEYRTVPCVSPC